MRKSFFIAMMETNHFDLLFKTVKERKAIQVDKEGILINEIENIVKVFYWLSYLEPTAECVRCCSCQVKSLVHNDRPPPCRKIKDSDNIAFVSLSFIPLNGPALHSLIKERPVRLNVFPAN